jgi:epsin
LQLLEYIIKHGSERVVDDARSHLSTIKMLRNFHYIDDKGKDQGINGMFSPFTSRHGSDYIRVVRNRSSEIAALLSDLDKIRTERRKAKSNRNKYTGTGNDGMMDFSGSSGRFGGFGNDNSYSGSGGGGYSGDTGESAVTHGTSFSVVNDARLCFADVEVCFLGRSLQRGRGRGLLIVQG